MKRVAVLGALTLVAMLQPAADARPREGRMVRIERPRLGSKHRVRLCIQPSPHAKMICLGAPPLAKGTFLHVLDFESGYVDLARVRSSKPSGYDKCKTGEISEITYELLGEPKGGHANPLVGISGIDIDPQVGKVVINPELPPGAKKGEQSWIGIDATSAKGPELLITSRECNDDNPPPLARNRPSTGQCISFWEHDGGAWHITSKETVWSCE